MFLCSYLNSLMVFLSPHRVLGGKNLPEGWGGYHKLGGDSDIITVEVNNPLTEKKIFNVFGVIKGFVDPGTVRILIS